MSSTPPPLPTDPRALEILEALPLGVLHVTNERIDYANAAFLRLVGCEPGDLLGRDAFEPIVPGHRERARAHYAERRAGTGAPPARYELEVVRKDGTRLRLEVEPRTVGADELLVLARDVTAQVRETSLLGKLGELALEVQRRRTVDDILETTAQGLNALGLHFMAGRLDGPRLVLERVAAVGEVAELIDAALGRSAVGLSAQVDHVAFHAQVVGERRMVFVDEVAPALIVLFRELGLAVDEDRWRAAFAALGRGMACPLLVEGRVWGLFATASHTLTTADAAALALFASQVASAVEMAGALARVERRNQDLAAIQRVAAAGGEPTLERLLSQLVGTAAEALASPAVAIYLLDEGRARLELAASNDFGRELAGRFRSYPLGQPLVARTFEQLHATQVDVARDVDTAGGAFILARGLTHLAIVPLHIKGRLAGGLALGRAGAYGAEELDGAEVMGRQMAIQIENARLYAEASRRLRLLTVLFDLSQTTTGTVDVKALCDRVLQQAVGVLSVDGAAIYVLDGAKLVLAGVHGEVPHPDHKIRGLPLEGSSLAVLALKERRTQHIDRAWLDAHPGVRERMGPCVAAMVSLLSNDRPQGTLLVARRRDAPFDAEEARMLEAMAARVAAALENARAFEEERRRLEDLKQYVEVGRVVTASLDLEQILEVSAKSLASISEATLCSMYLLDPVRRVLQGVAISEPDGAFFRTVRLALDDRTLAGRAVLTGKPLIVADVAREPSLRQDLIERYGLASMAVLPLIVRGKAIGAVVIGDKSVRAWTAAQIERANVVAQQVAVAVANARLYEDLKSSYDQLARTQQELVKRERLAALGELSAVVAHEVRNPLGVIFNSLRSLKRVLRPEGDVGMLIDILGEEADRLNRIVGDLLDFARPSEPSLQPEPLGGVLDWVVEAAAASAAASGVRIQVEARPPLPRPAVDARMLRQALLNLVINAVQAMPRGGAVTLRVREERRDAVPVARIEVEDTGPGIAPEISERIFQPFFTTKAAGTGLGLAVVKRIVEAHNGEVSLASAPGKGARFTLLLPIPFPDAAQAEG